MARKIAQKEEKKGTLWGWEYGERRGGNMKVKKKRIVVVVVAVVR